MIKAAKLNKTLRYLSLLIFCACSFSAFAVGDEMLSGFPGGIIKIPLGPQFKNEPKVTFNKNRVLTYYDKDQWHALVGIPLTQKTGKVSIEVEPVWGPGKVISFNINEKHYPQERIQIKDKNKVKPPSKDWPRIQKESESLKRTYAHWEPKTIKSVDLTQPVQGRISSQFGFKRIINNIPKSPHKGLDIAANTGTPVKAAQQGKVTLVGDLFYTGHTVVVDHGQGWQTIYCHLNTVSVKTGQQVDSTTTLGTVGQTGRATGPHLHFGVILNQVKVDPSLFWKGIS